MPLFERAKFIDLPENLYGFLFTAPNHIQDSSKQIWKTYQERLYAMLKSIIDFTIPESSCNLFYKNSLGEIY